MIILLPAPAASAVKRKKEEEEVEEEEGGGGGGGGGIGRSGRRSLRSGATNYLAIPLLYSCITIIIVVAMH